MEKSDFFLDEVAQRSVFYGHHFIEEPEQSLVYVYGVVD